MKTIERILIILTVFIALSGLMVVAVNASGANAPDFGGPLPGIRQGDGGDQFRPENGTRPESDQNRPEREERGERGGDGSRWMFGLIKNIGLMAILITIIVLPKSVAKKRKRQAGMKSANGQS
jgi:hypothetical protein